MGELTANSIADHVSDGGAPAVSTRSMPAGGNAADSIWTTEQVQFSVSSSASALPGARTSAGAPTGKRGGMMSWMWRTFVVDDDDSSSISLQEAAQAEQLEGFAPHNQIAVCIHFSGIAVSLKHSVDAKVQVN